MGTPTRGTDPRQQPGFGRRIEGHFQGRMLDGLIRLAPVLLTLFVLGISIEYTDALVRPLPFVQGRAWDFPGVGIIVIVVGLYLVGLLVSNAIGRRMMDAVDAVLSKVPVVKNVYGVTEQATTLLTSEYNFSRVVFLEWPREGMTTIGLVTGRAYSERGDHSLAIVFIPTLPNPTSGNVAIINEDDLLETDIMVEDAIKMIFSGGIVLPQRLGMARVPRRPAEREFIGGFETRPR